jgi:hypothetical protein
MKINQNNDISIYRGETGAIDFKISQRADYYVPFLITTDRVNPMICITIGSTRRESTNIVTKQLWLDLDEAVIPRFITSSLGDLGILSAESEVTMLNLMTIGTMYQFKREAEVLAGNPILHFAYEDSEGSLQIDTYHFTVIMAIDENITLDMTNLDYFYQIELLDTEPMISHLQTLFTNHPELVAKLPAGFINTELGITTYLKECITLINRTWPNYWGYRINNPFTSPVARVNNIRMLQPPRRFTVQAVIK